MHLADIQSDAVSVLKYIAAFDAADFNVSLFQLLMLSHHHFEIFDAGICEMEVCLKHQSNFDLMPLLAFPSVFQHCRLGGHPTHKVTRATYFVLSTRHSALSNHAFPVATVRAWME